MEVIDNFLQPYQFNAIKSTLLNDNYFNWYWQDGVNHPIESNYFQFTHIFYSEEDGHNSPYLDMFECVSCALNVKKLRSIKANLNPRTFFKRFHGWHSDYPAKNGFEPAKTAILYINTNNGYTKFKKGGKVKCVENRLLLFDSYLLHSGVTCTDKKRKVVVNFNYL